ncbi:hypothetical protein BJ508DRAFT_303259 [Ascobolus immersus RN42]|uniref:Uncharacterized protein n=1 Tax=Ascobolus immersus RN42 TaxID=1160509 RepID=A0A3N4IHF5_ASCIM|nr:hypothetical protein BJ508DRAFT_303259 [Ascobolus immersus RN42]
MSQTTPSLLMRHLATLITQCVPPSFPQAAVERAAIYLATCNDQALLDVLLRIFPYMDGDTSRSVGEEIAANRSFVLSPGYQGCLVPTLAGHLGYGQELMGAVDLDYLHSFLHPTIPDLHVDGIVELPHQESGAPASRQQQQQAQQQQGNSRLEELANLALQLGGMNIDGPASSPPSSFPHGIDALSLDAPSNAPPPARSLAGQFDGLSVHTPSAALPPPFGTPVMQVTPPHLMQAPSALYTTFQLSAALPTITITPPPASSVSAEITSIDALTTALGRTRISSAEGDQLRRSLWQVLYDIAREGRVSLSQVVEAVAQREPRIAEMYERGRVEAVAQGRMKARGLRGWVGDEMVLLRNMGCTEPGRGHTLTEDGTREAGFWGVGV